MLSIRPNCEYCDRDLPPDSVEAMICSFECTFCADCVDTVLSNVCPNCGGGFVPRPIRPAHAWCDGVSLSAQPAIEERKHQLVNPDDQRELIARAGQIAPEQR